MVMAVKINPFGKCSLVRLIVIGIVYELHSFVATASICNWIICNCLQLLTRLVSS